ncbi:MAG: hypothetical protein LBR34_00065 [Prevotella sp.]|jgi:amino acid permease|nr:hypothetical protein [Prevotella sp.]
MKKCLMILGGIITVVGLLQTGRVFYSHYLSNEYGKGYLLGSVLLLIIGIALIIVGRRKQ